ALPMALYLWRYPHTLDLRFSKLSAWRDHPPAMALAQRIATNYFNHLSFGFLFRTGDTNIRHSIGGVGFLPLWLFAPFICGIWMAFRQRSRPFMRFLLAMVVVSPIPVSICDGYLHNSRMLHFAPLAVTFGAIAIVELWKRWPPSLAAITLALAVA